MTDGEDSSSTESILPFRESTMKQMDWALTHEPCLITAASLAEGADAIHAQMDYIWKSFDSYGSSFRFESAEKFRRQVQIANVMKQNPHLRTKPCNETQPPCRLIKHGKDKTDANATFLVYDRAVCCQFDKGADDLYKKCFIYCELAQCTIDNASDVFSNMFAAAKIPHIIETLKRLDIDTVYCFVPDRTWKTTVTAFIACAFRKPLRGSGPSSSSPAKSRSISSTMTRGSAVYESEDSAVESESYRSRRKRSSSSSSSYPSSPSAAQDLGTSWEDSDWSHSSEFESESESGSKKRKLTSNEKELAGKSDIQFTKPKTFFGNADFDSDSAKETCFPADAEPIIGEGDLNDMALDLDLEEDQSTYWTYVPLQQISPYLGLNTVVSLRSDLSQLTNPSIIFRTEHLGLGPLQPL